METTVVGRADGWVRPHLLRWAREQVGLGIEEAARSLGVQPDKLRAWEAGTDRPSVSDLEQLARTYMRSLGDFFLDAPPTEPTLDLRLGPDLVLSPQMREHLLFFRLLYQDATALLERIGQRPPRIESLPNAPEVLAKTKAAAHVVRSNLGDGSSARDRYKALEMWRNAVEQVGVLTFSLPLAPRECRGASLWPQDGPPAILFSSRDAISGRIFTILHEFVHLAMRETSGYQEIVCGFRQETERAANAVASEVLVPSEDFQAELTQLDRNAYRDDWVDNFLQQRANRFNVSKDVIAIRLENLELAPSGFYERKRDAWDAKPYPPFPRGGQGRPKKWQEKRAQLGDYYSGAITRAWRESTISFGEAVRLLGLPPAHTHRFLEEMGRPGSS